MSTVETKLRLHLMDISVGVPTEEAVAQGIDKMDVTLNVGLALDAFRNQVTGDPLMIPLGEISVAFSKEQAAGYIEAMSEGIAQMPDTKKSDVLIANNLSQVEQAAAEMNRLAGK